MHNSTEKLAYKIYITSIKAGGWDDLWSVLNPDHKEPYIKAAQEINKEFAATEGKLIEVLKKLIACAEVMDAQLCHEYNTGLWEEPAEIIEARAILAPIINAGKLIYRNAPRRYRRQLKEEQNNG